MAVDFANDLVLITAASGKQGGALLQHVAPQWKRLRLQCVSDSSASKLRKQYPHAEVVQTEFRDLADARKLLQDVTVCFVVTPAFHPRETQCGLNMIDAALEVVQAGGPFRHLVLSSVLHSVLTPMVNHDSKRLIEEALVQSGLNYTTVQPSHMMDNLRIKALVAEEKPVHYVPYSPETKFSHTALHDFGQAVANILAERERHYFATYQLVSGSPTSYRDVVEIISAEIGRKVEVRSISARETADKFVSAMQTHTTAEKDAMRTGVLRMFTFYDRCGLLGNSAVMRMLIGREPLSYRDWVQLQLRS